MTEPSLQSQLRAFVDAPDDEHALTYLQQQSRTLMTEAALAALAPMLAAETQPERQSRIQARQNILQAAVAFHTEFWQTHQDLSELLVQWVNAADWDLSEAYIREHAGVLVSGPGELSMRFLAESQPNNTTLAGHLTILQRCREAGISEAYAEVRRLRPDNVEALQQLMRAVFGFVQAEDEDSARQLFDAQPDLLQRPDAESLLTGLIQTAQHQEDTGLQQLAESRLTLWRTFRDMAS